ncbi:ABC transporter permease subunit [Tetragenococcus koreensis]|uniref:Amino acid ABC transporter substrate-binding and permease protein n=1 Tax=Tetragenococcus koreensis TaxID=290335 RepID=A0AAN4UB27_9ENTE|nr:ABC transporter permease subunit [Tetragenococcus koreensis]MDN6278990.1 ABC transporter permease subunit [Lactococcus lactis]MCF1584348.1 ABC transporter permease subunit [Tetragenococcus koreensis]MCF1613897.1 ABC transporter permease subunit [Tetragenococcus koreensis]MCF1616088.1 ABC transporter permease subunit [Tetragenococcus koreensis]MCF1618560.1 ABC transporter permease subunit [Tetragenococcus koreensis]
MKKFKKLFLVLIPFLMLFAQLFPTVQASAEEEQQDERYDAIMERGELVVGLSADYAPYEFHATVDGEDEIVGFDVSIAQKIADDMGVDLHIEELGFDALLGALDTGKIDLIISGMSPTPERLQEVDFSDPYMNSQQRLVVREEDQDEYTDVNQFEGVPIGVQKQTTQEELANTELEGSQVTSLQKIPDVVMNLKNGKVDGAVLEGPVAKAYVDENDDLAFSNVEFEDGAKQSAVALPKDSPILSENINRSIQTINDENLLEGYQEEANNLMFDEDQSFFEEYYPYYLSGTGYTILLAIVGVIFGIILGTIFALMKLSSIKILRALASIYIEYVRGTPLLVQIFIVYFGTGILGLDLSRFVAGCIALSLNSAAYVAEIIRAGINGVNKGQMEAARSLGMDRTKAMRYIIFPQAIKNILPALGNEFVTVIKESSVISVIGVSELIFQAGNVQGASFKPFLPYLIVSLIYFVLTFTLSRLLGVAERRMKTSD